MMISGKSCINALLFAIVSIYSISCKENGLTKNNQSSDKKPTPTPTRYYSDESDDADYINDRSSGSAKTGSGKSTYNSYNSYDSTNNAGNGGGSQNYQQYSNSNNGQYQNYNNGQYQNSGNGQLSNQNTNLQNGQDNAVYVKIGQTSGTVGTTEYINNNNNFNFKPTSIFDCTTMLTQANLANQRKYNETVAINPILIIEALRELHEDNEIARENLRECLRELRQK
ncbi:MAG: hypothetical protein HQK54_14915 [Oligoflexales bacterium]|nr:hypothetical protein [Oligoflexales bacterium]